MRLPRDRIFDWYDVNRARTSAEAIGVTPEHIQLLEQTFLVRMLLRDERGRLTVEAIDEDAPRLLELGMVVVRPIEGDNSKVRLSFRPASPTLAAVRPMAVGIRIGPRAAASRAETTRSGDIGGGQATLGNA